MKKLLVVAVALIGIIAVKVYAGTQYNWGTSTGQQWITPDDTALTPNTFVVIKSTAGNIAPTVTTTGQPWLQSQTITQINASTASAVGQLVFCSNCVQSFVCVSTGTTNIMQWAIISATSTAANLSKCQ